VNDKLTTCLWFDTEAEEAAAFYCSLFPDSAVTRTTHYGEAGPREAGMVMTVELTIGGRPFVALNGGPEFKFNEAVSFQVSCADQDEVDRYWEALTADGGEEGPCGWVKDRFGLSWQVIPDALPELMTDPDPARSSRANAAMLQMRKLDIAAPRAAADGTG